MVRGKHNSGPSNQLSIVAQKIRQGRVAVNPDVVRDAFQDFGWAKEDVLRAIRKLKADQCYKTSPFVGVPGVMVDYYRATIDNELVYTHFYIDTSGFLVIDSFHTQQ